MSDHEEIGQLPRVLSRIREELNSLTSSGVYDSHGASNVANVQRLLLQLKLSSDDVRSSDVQKTVSEIVATTTAFGELPEIRDPMAFDTSELNYDGYISNSTHAFYLLLLLLKELSLHKDTLLAHGQWLQKHVIIPCLSLCSCHAKRQPWTNEKTCKYSSELINVVTVLCDCADISELLQGCKSFPEGVAKPYLRTILPQLTRDNWKTNLNSLLSFEWCLFNLKHPYVGELLSEVLPPSLLFVDDYNLENKILGVKCLAHIIHNVNPTELQWYGRAEVVYKALEHLLYSQEAELIPVLHPCLLSILRVVEENPQHFQAMSKRGRYSKILEKIVSDMELEQKIVLRRAYPVCLHLFIDGMGISVVRHIKTLLSLFSTYLNVYDGPEETSRLLILRAFKSLIIAAWPRIPFYNEEILKIILKFVYDVRFDKSSTSDSVKEELISQANECLQLLVQLTPDVLAIIQKVNTDQSLQLNVIEVHVIR